MLASLLAVAALLAGSTAASATVQVGRDSSRGALEDTVKAGLKDPQSVEAKEENAELAKLAASAEQAVAEILQNAWKLPLAAGAYRLTARFGQCSGLWSHCHTGLDFAAPEGTPIVAVANGVIDETGWAGAYGNRTVMTLEDGTELWFCHQSAFNTEPGAQVVGGQTIGFVGATGNTTGPHLHLEVRPGGGDAVDPFQALTVHGLQP
jgi:murein DD-endopeptidase MepM/ murein hydrolase activator NlpD